VTMGSQTPENLVAIALLLRLPDKQKARDRVVAGLVSPTVGSRELG